MEATRQVDARGLCCPMPIVKTRQAMKQAEVGDVIEVLATDRGAPADFRAWAEQTENRLLDVEETDGVLRLYLRKLVPEVQEQGRLWDKEMTLDELEDRLTGADAPLVLDVREEDEYESGHIPGARHVPVEVIERIAEQLDNRRPIAVVCRTARRSAYACRILSQSGFTDVYNVVPGMTAWRGPLQA